MAKQKEKKVAREIEVIVESDGHVTRHATEDQWDRDDTSTSHYVRGIRVLKEGEYSRYGRSVPVDFEPKPGEAYTVVCAQYSTGDSFGHDDGQGFEVVGVYRNRKVADENVARIEKHYDIDRRLERSYPPMAAKERKELMKKHNSFSVDLKTDDGRVHQIHVPWTGYFESLDWVRAETFTLS